MLRILAIAIVSLAGACSDTAVNSTFEDSGFPEGDSDHPDTGDSGSEGDGGRLNAGDTGTDLTSDAASDTETTDTGADGDVDGDTTDMERSDAGRTDMSVQDVDGVDMASNDTGRVDASPSADMTSGDMASTDTGSGGYDTTGWDMKQWTTSGTASTGTPDSYFFDVDAGSPMAASITGGGNGTWSVNVFGGMTNTLYCTGTASCQVMLDPQDTVVVVTTITTDIGQYSLTVDYAGQGPR